MKKKLIASVLALATCFAFGGALAGCSGKEGTAGKDGAAGAAGAAGKSAYEIWLDQGNTGSEVDFLNSLKGSGSATCDHENMMKAELINVADLMSPNGYPVHTSTYNAETEEWEYTNGTVLNVCVDCGYSKITEEVLHVMKDEGIASTCTTPGFEGSYCVVCDYHEGEELPLGEHVVDETNVRPLNTDADRNICEDGGLVASVCTECHEGFVKELDPQDHIFEDLTLNHIGDDYFLVGTCTGLCAKEIEIELPAISKNNYHFTPASCKDLTNKKDVYSLYVNKANGKWSAIDETVGELMTIKEVTEGVVAYHKVVVGKDTYIMNHDNDYYPVTGENSFAAAITQGATSTAKCDAADNTGSGSYTCNECGNMLIVKTVANHVWGEKTVNPAPAGTTYTCTQDRTATAKCTLCETVNELLPYEPIGHTYEYALNATKTKITKSCKYNDCDAIEYELVGEPETVPSTCKVAGSITFTAMIDGEAKSITEALPLAYHTVVVGNTTYVMDKDNSFYYVTPAAGQINYFEAIDQGATTTAKCDVNDGFGSGAYFCTVCGDMNIVKTFAGHVPVAGSNPTVITPAGCETTGLQKVNCAGCGKADAEEVIPALGHNCTYTLVRANATEFTFTVACDRCDLASANYTETVTVYNAETNPDGKVIFTAKDTNVACGTEVYDLYEIKVDGKVVASVKENTSIVPHTVEYNGKPYVMEADTTVVVGGVEYKAYNMNNFPFIKQGATSTATCKDNNGLGQGSYTCSICEAFEIVDTYQPHTYNEEDPTAEKLDPTCTVNGWIKGICTVCGDVATEPTTIPATGHTFEKVEITLNNANTATAFTANAVCACGYSQAVELPALSAEAWAVTYNKAATCTEAGKTVYQATIDVVVAASGDFLGSTEKVTFVVTNNISATNPGHNKPADADTMFWFEEETVEVTETVEGAVYKVTYKVTYKHFAFLCDKCNEWFEYGTAVEVEGSRVEIDRVELQ